jgi:hypothetical protein
MAVRRSNYVACGSILRGHALVLEYHAKAR